MSLLEEAGKYVRVLGTHLFLQAHDTGPFLLQKAFIFLDGVGIEDVFWQGEFLSQRCGSSWEIVRG